MFEDFFPGREKYVIMTLFSAEGGNHCVIFNKNSNKYHAKGKRI